MTPSTASMQISAPSQMRRPRGEERKGTTGSDLAGERDVARRVEEVDQVRLAAGVGQHQRDGRRGDADAALLLRHRGVCVANVLAEVPRLRARGLDQHVQKERLAFE